MFTSDKGDIRAKKTAEQGDTQHRSEGRSFRKTQPSCVCPHTPSCQVCETKPTGPEGEPDKSTLTVETARSAAAKTGSPSHPGLCSPAQTEGTPRAGCPAAVRLPQHPQSADSDTPPPGCPPTSPGFQDLKPQSVHTDQRQESVTKRQQKLQTLGD